MKTKSLSKGLGLILFLSSLFIGCEDFDGVHPDSEGRHKPVVLLGGTEGIFKASALGETFQPSNKGLSGNALIAQAFLDQRHTIYVGTKNGVYRSSNNGKSWTPSNNGMSGAGLNVITLFQKGKVILAGTFGGGVYASTNGTSWTQMNTGLSGNALIVRAIVRHDNDAIYIGTHNGVYRLSYGGTSWESVNDGLENPNDLTVVGLASKDGSLYAATFGGLLKELEKNSSSWYTLDSGFDEGFVNAVAVVGDKLYVGGNTYGVFVYDGNTFEPFNNGLPSSNLRIRAFAVKGNNVLMSTINGGTYYTTDGTTWIANSGEEDDADYWGLLLR